MTVSVDYYATAVNVDGAMLVATIPAANYDRELLRVAITGPANTGCDLYRSSIDPSNLFDTTEFGQRNTAEYGIPPLHLPAGISLLAVWTGSGVGSDSSATLRAEMNG